MDGNYNIDSNFSLGDENYYSIGNTNGFSKEAHKSSSKRTVYDAIHGHLEFDSYVWDFIDTIEFQRLRNLKQLGNCHFVFPGGTHSRFEHSIGTAYLSNRLITQLVKGVRENTCVFNINNTTRINEDFNVQAVTLAGLLHDLGHGPFSHLFDRKVIKFLNPNLTWEHENGSSMLVEYLIDNNNIDIETDQRKLVQSLILGDIRKSTNDKFHYESWIYQIVANKKNSIDVDKFDYLCRDVYHIGLQSSNVDYDRIFNSVKIIDNNLCFNIKVRNFLLILKNDYNLLKLFQNRYKLFKQVYLHKKSIAIDLMIKDILILSNSYFNFTEVIFDPEEYIKLDDSILDTIGKFSDDQNNNNPDLLKAARMVKNLRYRDIYKYVGEILIPNNSPFFKGKITIEDIISYNNPKDENYIRPEDLELVFNSIDYGNGERNPFESILFYKNECDHKSFTIPTSKLSLSVPKVFKESYMLLYCKDSNKVERAKEIFKAFVKKLNAGLELNETDNYSTPIKNNKNGFISNKREREFSGTTQSQLNSNLNIQFNKIN